MVVGATLSRREPSKPDNYSPNPFLIGDALDGLVREIDPGMMRVIFRGAQTIHTMSDAVELNLNRVLPIVASGR
jgi:hypothetical protein